uniref:COesterase domain-containing protein n=1 Tax=Steinernema glaseri TaxID=37863 RepID=A0A1I7YW25_9BILA
MPDGCPEGLGDRWPDLETHKTFIFDILPESPSPLLQTDKERPLPSLESQGRPRESLPVGVHASLKQYLSSVDLGAINPSAPYPYLYFTGRDALGTWDCLMF